MSPTVEPVLMFIPSWGFAEFAGWQGILILVSSGKFGYNVFFFIGQVKWYKCCSEISKWEFSNCWDKVVIRCLRLTKAILSWTQTNESDIFFLKGSVELFKALPFLRYIINKINSSKRITVCKQLLGHYHGWPISHIDLWKSRREE